MGWRRDIACSTTVSPGQEHYGAEGRPGGQEDWQWSGNQFSARVVRTTASPEAWGRGRWLTVKHQEPDVRDWWAAEQGPDVHKAEHPTSPSSLATGRGCLRWWRAGTAGDWHSVCRDDVINGDSSSAGLPVPGFVLKQERIHISPLGVESRVSVQFLKASLTHDRSGTTALRSLPLQSCCASCKGTGLHIPENSMGGYTRQ